jgi:serine/threonine protein kinase
MQSRRRLDVKLVDFGQANRITTIDGEPVERTGTAEFMAPEKVAGENVGVAADIWGIGVLAFILLSGVSPFNGETQTDTFANIKHVYYDANTLYHNVTKYSLKFIYQTLKRNPRARLTTEECLDHRWLMLNPAMVKSRKMTVFSTDKLKYFLEDYMYRRMRNARLPDRLLSTYGASTESVAYDEDAYFYNRRLSQSK